MPLYEHVYLARQDLSPQQVEELTTQLSGVVDQLGGKVTKNEYWGLKSLTYRIRKNRKAHMTLLNVDAPASALSEIERQERLNEDVLRYLTIRVDELEEGPSAMMRKADRDRDGERGDRGDRATVWIVVTVAIVRRVSAAAKTKRRRNKRWHSHRRVGLPAVRSSAAARPARSREPMRRRSTTRTQSCCSVTSPSAARSCRAASRRCRRRNSVNSPRRSSARASSASCRT